jgi:DNA-binding PadR family transcriptional regulator
MTDNEAITKRTREMTQAEKEARILRQLTEPMSGKALADFSELSVAQFYPTIMRMEREGKVISAWADGPYPRRRIYRLPE